MSRANWYDKLLRDPKLEWDTATIGFGFAEDPSLEFIRFFTDSGIAPDGKSLGGYSNPEFDQWVIRAEGALNEEDLTEAYQEAEKILLRDTAAIPVYFLRLLIAWNNKV